MRLHAEIPLVALFRLVHLGIARLVRVFGRSRRTDDGRIDDRAGGHLQPLGGEMPLHLGEQPPAQIVRLQQVAEAAHRRLVRNRLAAEVDADETPHRQRIVERFFHRRVRQVEPLLQKVDAQHPLDPDRRPAVAGLGIKRLDQPAQRRPRHHAFHLGQKCRPPRRLGVALEPRRRQRRLSHLPTPARQLPRRPLYHDRRPVTFAEVP